jgi:biopolymer transport protein ExbD
MKKLVATFALMGLFSCNNEEVLLPQENVSVMKEITDHSPIYMFFKTEENPNFKEKLDTIVAVNRKNSIASNNWVFNIDKRLPLKLVIPVVMQLQEEKKSSLHVKGGEMNFFTYSDSVAKNLAYFPFTDVQYKYSKHFSKFFIKSHAEHFRKYHNFTVNFNKDNKITVDGNDIERDEFIEFITEFADFTNDGKITMLHLNFDNRLTYEQYIQNKILAWKATNNEIQLSSFEFVYDENKLPECGCKL